MLQVSCQVVGPRGHQILQIQQQIRRLVIRCVHVSIAVPFPFETIVTEAILQKYNNNPKIECMLLVDLSVHVCTCAKTITVGGYFHSVMPTSGFTVISKKLILLGV